MNRRNFLGVIPALVLTPQVLTKEAKEPLYGIGAILPPVEGYDYSNAYVWVNEQGTDAVLVQYVRLKELSDREKGRNRVVELVRDRLKYYLNKSNKERSNRRKNGILEPKTYWDSEEGLSHVRKNGWNNTIKFIKRISSTKESWK